MSMINQPPSTPVKSCIGVFYPTVLNYEAKSTRQAHFMPSINCPFCGTEGQYDMPEGKHHVNYCSGCEITWKYILKRRI